MRIVSFSQVKECVGQGSYYAFPWPNSVKLELQIHQPCGLLLQMLEEKVKRLGLIIFNVFLSYSSGGRITSNCSLDLRNG